MNMDLSTPVWQLTLGDLLDIFQKTKQEEPPKVEDYTGNDCVYGISGIAKLLGVSKPMVQEYRRQGWIEPALMQRGRKIICDAPLALKLFGERK